MKSSIIITKYFLSCFLVLLFIGSEAQQIPVLQQYVYHPFLYNPARAGSNAFGEVVVNHRQQWLDLPDAPISSILAIDSPLKKSNVGIGGMVFSDETHIINKMGGMFTYAYHLPFNKAKTTRLSFGVSAGAFSQRMDFFNAVVEDPNDQSILENEMNGWVYDMGAGLNFQVKGLNIGFSVPQVIGNSAKLLDNAGDKVQFQLARHYMASASYKLGLGKDKSISMEPVVFARYIPNLPLQVEGNLLLGWKDIFYVGAGYRSSSVNAIMATAGVRIKKRYGLSYTFESSGADNSTIGTTHEASISFRFGKLSALDPDLTDRLDSLAKEIKKLRYNAKQTDAKAEANSMENDQQGEQIGGLDVDTRDNSDRISDLLEQIQSLRDSGDNSDKMKSVIDRLIEEVKRLEGEINKLRNRPLQYRKLGTVYFPVNSDVLRQKEQSKLDALAENLRHRSLNFVLYVCGNASEEGASTSNLVLSVERSVAARDYLSKAGLSKDNIIMLPYGEENPENLSQDTEAGRRVNRRVDIYILEN